MELFSARQVGPEILTRTEYDLFILVSGYEQRCVYLPEKYNINARKKIALAFEERKGEKERKRNDDYFLAHEFQLLKTSGESLPGFSEILASISSHKRPCKILLDYSSMTKVWISGIINEIISNPKYESDFQIHFSYTPAVYNEPVKARNLKYTGTISYPYKKASQTNKPTALIIGMGLDPVRAEFTKKKLNPAVTFLMYADPSNDIKYVKQVLSNNYNLIEQTEVRNLFSFPLNDLNKTNDILTELCFCLRARYNLVIAPMGPKTLTLLSLLLSARYPDINVIRVSPGSNAPAFDRKPAFEPVIYEVEFHSETAED